MERGARFRADGSSEGRKAEEGGAMSHWAQDCPMLDGVACEEHGRPPAPRPITLTREQGEAVLEALDSAKAGVWDAYYGKGIAVEYARAVDEKASAALSVLRTAMSEKGEGR
jgi:hypothetical protein